MLPGCEDREIAEQLTDRPLQPSDVFCFPLVCSWRARIWNLFDDFITDEVKTEFVQNPPEYIFSDDLSWLDEMIFEVTGRVSNIKELAAKRFGREFRAFRAAHATRTNDLALFYERGLRFLRPEEIEEKARAIFNVAQSEPAAEKRFQMAIDEIQARDKSGGRNGRLYFCANERSLIDRSGGSGHYLIYGSEYLYCIGIRVAGTWNAKKTLKAIGRPTMFVCDIPIEMMRSSTVEEFVGIILGCLFRELLSGQESDVLNSSVGSALSLAVDVPAECIVGHYHPAMIYDPFWSA